MPRGHLAPIDYHRRLLEDAERLTAYERALRQLVRPGCVVLDLGAGTGILAMLAARLGAARVHAVESMPIAQVARQLVSHNGLDDLIQVHQADAVALAPIEPVDLVVSDCLGAFLGDDCMSAAVAAAGRWLRPEGTFCPAVISLWVAPVGSFVFQSIDLFEQPFYGVDLSGALPYLLNTTYRLDVSPQCLLGAPVAFLTVRPPELLLMDHEVQLAITSPGRLRGLAGWFEATLAPDVVLSNAPGIDSHWSQYFFPLPAVDVQTGDVLEVHIVLVSEEPGPWWRWSGTLRRDGQVMSSFALESEERLGQRSLAGTPKTVLVADESAAKAWARQGKEAYERGEVAEAAQHWEAALLRLPPDDTDQAPLLYENLGIAYGQLRLFPAAIRAFERALDGQLDSREQALRLLIFACQAGGRPIDAARFRRVYEKAFGPLQ